MSRRPLILTDKQIQALHEAMKYLARRDRDRATEINRKGFSAFDTIKGHKLAEKEKFTYDDAVIAFQLAFKYRKQLPRKLKKKIFTRRKKGNEKFSKRTNHSNSCFCTDNSKLSSLPTKEGSIRTSSERNIYGRSNRSHSRDKKRGYASNCRRKNYRRTRKNYNFDETN